MIWESASSRKFRGFFGFQEGSSGMKTILDRSFKYIPSADTDLRKTFERIRRKLKEQDHAQSPAEAEAKSNVSPIQQRKSILAA